MRAMLPRVLIDPPWLSPRSLRQTPLPPTSAPTRPDLPTEVRWPAGLREHWLESVPAAKAPSSQEIDEEWLDRILEHLDAGKGYRESDVARLSDGALVDLLAEGGARITAVSARYIVARLEERAIAPLATLLRRTPEAVALRSALAPLFSVEIAELFLAAHAGHDRIIPNADDLRDHRFEASLGEAWFERFAEPVARVIAAHEAAGTRVAAGREAAVFLVARGHGDALRGAFVEAGLPAPSCLALGSIAELRDDGLDWLPLLIGRNDTARVMALVGDAAEPRLAGLFGWWLREGLQAQQAHARTWFAAHAEAASDEVRAVLRQLDEAEDERLREFPKEIPALPAFWDPSKLPAPRLPDGSELPLDALGHLGTMLRFSPAGEPYHGLVQVREACDAVSLDEFVLALLEAYEGAGAPQSESWCLAAVEHLGGERAGARLLALNESDGSGP